jgi:hypothetical protein
MAQGAKQPMKNNVEVKNKIYVLNRGSKAWANDLLRYFLRDILYNKECWIRHPYNKILLGYDVIDQLESYGYFWQSSRVKNHIHRWMKSLSCRSVGPDISLKRERGDS